MPTKLSDLELDEVSLVGKAANGKKFLIFKSMDKSKGSITMKTPKPAGASAGAGRAQVTKADIVDIVNKAIAPLQEENARLRKSLDRQTSMLQSKEYVEIAKSHFSELGKPEDVAKDLEAIAALPKESRDRVLKSWKQANAMKKESNAILTKAIGTSRPAPGSAREEFYGLVEKKIGEVRKSDAGKKAGDNPAVLKALAITEVSKEHPDLAKMVDAEQRADMVKKQMGVA